MIREFKKKSIPLFKKIWIHVSQTRGILGFFIFFFIFSESEKSPQISQKKFFKLKSPLNEYHS